MMPIMLEVILSKHIVVRKKFDELGNWEHEEIVLTSKNPDYNPIIINEEDAEEFRIIGEFAGIIKD